MKTLIPSLLILFSISSFSQPYLPMLEEGNVWNTVTYNYPDPATITNRTYEITGQEVIDGINYFTFNAACMMREENGKEYAYSQGIKEILFDFTLEVGDEIILDPLTAYNCYEIGGIYIQGEPITVSNFSTQFLAGADRKVIELEYDGQAAETWVEGIGTLNGFVPFGFTNFDSS